MVIIGGRSPAVMKLRDGECERQPRFSYGLSPGEGKMKPKEDSGKQKGGLVTMPFILANEAFEKVASYGLLPNMIVYLMKDYKTGVAGGTNILFFWSAATNFMPIVGAFLSDSYFGRFLTICLGCVFSLLGMVLLWLTTIIPQAKPSSCDQSTQICKSATPGQYTFLITALAFMSIGAGGIRPCSMAFGADQIDNRDNPKNERVLESFFGWYYASASFALLISFTGIVYIQEHLGWRVGFGVPAIIMLFSAVCFFVASPMYLRVLVKKAVFTSLVQVVVVAFKNRKVALSPTGDLYNPKDSEVTTPTEKLRFLNKACIIRNPDQQINPDGMPSDPWSLCTVEQVEELKALIRVIPLWSSSIMMSINVSQASFYVLQANTMDRHLTPSFQIPAGSFVFFLIITIMIWIAIYDRLIIPTASKLRGKPVRLGVKKRMGIGLLFSCIAMAVSGTVEHVRRRKAIEQGFLDDPHAVISMSALWLVPQYVINGLAEAFNAIGQTEFYYSELPKSMSSIASALFYLGMAVANLLASVIVSSVDRLTRGEGKESWISSNLNKGHYEKYFWLLAIMSSINLLYFILCSLAYGPCGSKMVKAARNKDSGDQKFTGGEMPAVVTL